MVLLLNTVLPTVPVFARDPASSDYEVTLAEVAAADPYLVVTPWEHTVIVEDQTQTYEEYMEEHTQILDRSDSESKEDDKWIFIDHTNYANVANTWLADYYTNYEAEAWQDGINDPAFAWGAVHQNTWCANGSNGCVDGHVMPWTPSKFPWLFINHNFDGNTEVVISYNGAVVLSGWFPSSQIEKYNLAWESAGSVDRTYGFVSVPEELNLGTAETAEWTAHGLDLSKFEVKLVPNITESDWKTDNPDRTISFADGVTPTDLSFKKDANNKIVLQQPAANPTKVWYTCNGWITEGYTFWKPITGDIVLDANCTANVYEITWNYMTAEWQASDTSTGAYQEMPTHANPDPYVNTTDHRVYTFSGWTPALTWITANTAYTAEYTAWDCDTGNRYHDISGTCVIASRVDWEWTTTWTAHDTTRVASGDSPVLPDSFSGYESFISGSMIYTVTWWKSIIEWKVVYNLSEEVVDGKVPVYSYSAIYGPTECVSGYHFNGSGECVDTYTVTYAFEWDIPGGVNPPAAQNYKPWDTITQAGSPIVDWYTFGGWTNVPETMPESDITITWAWTINQYTIGFDSDGWTAVDSITEDYNTSINAPTEPTKTGYTFTWWYNWEEKVEFPVNMPVDGLNLKAHWDINQYTIEFDSDGWTAVDSITDDYDKSIAAPTEPTKTGYTFTWWYNWEEKVEFPVNMPVDGLNLKAHWDINQYTIGFDSDGWTAVDSITEDYNTSINAPTEPTKTGYTFTWWYNWEEKVEFPVNMPVDGLNLKAHWDINEYEVTWSYKDSGWNDVTETWAVAYNQSPSHGNPATYEKDGKIYTFTWWTKEGVEGIVILADEVITWEVTYSATYDETEKPKSSSSSGGWGGGSSKTSASDETKATTSDNAKDDSKTDDETKLYENGEENANEWENKDEEKVAPMTEAQAVAKFGQEQIDAYKWALENGITTMKTVEDARLDEPLTRAELAKMMVVYIQKVLKKDPVVTWDVKYSDVKVEEIWDLVDYVKLAYQYQIMWINADGTPIELFNPHGIVSRWEYATVFSRVLFGDKFNKSGEDFYTNHLEALKTAWILTNTLPSIQEMRGWVMLMMYRSSQNGEAIEKVVTATEENKDETKAEETTNAESTTGDTAEIPTTEEKSETTVENIETMAESTTGDVAEVNTWAVAEVATWDAASN